VSARPVRKANSSASRKPARPKHSRALERADENELKRNVIAGNALTGILIAGSNRNEIVGNEISGNAGGGIAIVGDAPSPSNENMLASNGVTSNAGDGIFVYGPSEFMGQLIPGATGTMVLANAADKNAGDGIDVRSAATTVTRNSANRNIDLGIDAVPGVVDGGGNRAQENGNPLQCVNVVCS
jgi:parallel beta-helix repeat protein